MTREHEVVSDEGCIPFSPLTLLIEKKALLQVESLNDSRYAAYV